MRQRKLGSHTPPCHRRMVIITLFNVLLAALQRRPVQRAIGGATLHHLQMAHQQYTNWAATVVYYMHADNQWLHMAGQGVEQLYPTSFHRVSRRLFWGAHEGRLWEFCRSQ